MGWLDQIKASVTIPEVLSYYRIEQWGSRALCPIHVSDHQLSFSFNDEVYYCFNCGSKGSVLDLVAAIEQCDIYDAAAFLAVKYKIQASSLGDNKRLMERVERYKSIAQLEFEEANQAFQLFPLEEYRGFSKETIAKWGLQKTSEDDIYI